MHRLLPDHHDQSQRVDTPSRISPERMVSALAVTELRDRGNIHTQPRHGDRDIHSTTARVCRDFQRFGLVTFREQQKRCLGIEHRHAFDAARSDNRNGVDHRASNGERFHCCVSVLRFESRKHGTNMGSSAFPFLGVRVCLHDIPYGVTVTCRE